MKVHILATGSSGNAVLLNHNLLIDAGITQKAFLSYGYTPDMLTGAIITHKHSDHMKLPFLRYLLKAGVPVWMPTDAISDLIKEGRLDAKPLISCGQIQILDEETRIQVGNIKITPYPQEHHDLINYALVVEKDSERLLYSTDLDTIEPTEMGVGLLHLGLFDTILLEGNYDETYLRSYIEQMISMVTEAENPKLADDAALESWVKANYRKLPDEVARNAFRAIQNHRHLSKQQARAYVKTHLKPHGTYYEIHRSSQFYEAPEGWFKHE